jgi:nicotinate-nucleotide pyrophosphorylase (carboxylating)
VLTPQIIDTVVRAALLEDAPWGDITSELLIPETAYASARLVSRESGVFSGGAVFAAAMSATDPAIRTELHVADGETFAAGATLATVAGPARAVLQAERVALNLVQRMSGIATLTAQYVGEISHTQARIVDTRKTTPGLRAFERHAVRSGGGHNHRFSLSDAVMAKDNHLAVLTSQSGLSVTDALRAVREQLSHTTHLEVEVDRIDQIEPVLAGGVDTIMLDNFTVDQLREGVALVAGRALVEASGNVNLSTVRSIAETGVDVISVGALTHSVRSLDLGLDVDIASTRAGVGSDADAGSVTP